VIFAIALVTGFRLREAAIGSGVLLTLFGISMALTFGMKAPLDYSVFTAATAAFSLALMAADHKREIRRRKSLNQRLSYSEAAPAVYKAMLVLQASVDKSGLEKT
jgi:hypothetical protein